MEKLTPQSTLAQALKNPKAVALAEKLKPGITKNPLITFVKGSTLERLCLKYDIPKAKLQEILDEINEM